MAPEVELSRQMSNSFSVSPEQALLNNTHSLSPQHSRDPRIRRYTTSNSVRELTPFNTAEIKILLLESVNQSGVDILKEQGYQVEALKSSLPEDELIAKLRSAF